MNNRYPFPLAYDYFHKLAKAKVFSNIVLRHGYYQVWIGDGDEVNTTMVTRYGSYEFLVKPFRLCNTSTNFFT
jgi:hypothetical protein